LTALDLDTDADAATVKAAYRRLAKLNHPDAAPDDPAAAARFQVIQAAYDVLAAAAERRS
jgi:DnaJ-class molecular chaperone